MTSLASTKRNNDMLFEVPNQQKQMVLVRPLTGMVSTDNFEVRDVAVDADLEKNDVLIRVLYVSMDPYLRIAELEGAGKLVQIDKPISNFGAGVVVRSLNRKFAPGTYVEGQLEWQEYNLIKGAQGLTQVDPPTAKLPLSYHVGVLGMPGATAYHGLLTLGRPRAGEAVFVSAAAGAVGQLVGQMAKLKGCRVVGSAGSDDKVQFLTAQLGFDGAFNYKAVDSLDAALHEHFPEGIDLYFDNVGGAMLDAVLGRMNRFGRIVACGMITQYNDQPQETFNNLMQIVFKSLTIKGVAYFEYKDKQKQFLRDVGKWLKDGKLKYKEHVTEGLENAPAAFVDLYQGKNFGKSVIAVGS